MKKLAIFAALVLSVTLAVALVSVAAADPPPWHWFKFSMEWDQDPDPTGDKDLALVTTPGFGGVYRYMDPGTQIDDISYLNYYFYVDAGDCGGGAPRLQLGIDTDGDGDFDGNAFGYGGPPPNFTDCTPDTWLYENAQDSELQWDLTQFGGAFYNTWAQVETFFSGNANHQVLWVVWVVDNYWTSEPGTIWLDDLNVDGEMLGEPSDQRR